MSTIARTASLALFITVVTFTSSFANEISYKATSDQGLTYELIVEAESPEVMKPLPVKLHIIDKDGVAINGAQLSCALTMPAMAMPTNMPPLKESDTPGEYKGIFLLTMGGLWHVELTMTCCGGNTDTVVIPIAGVISDGNENDVDSKLESLFQEGKE